MVVEQQQQRKCSAAYPKLVVLATMGFLLNCITMDSPWLHQQATQRCSRPATLLPRNNSTSSSSSAPTPCNNNNNKRTGVPLWTARGTPPWEPTASTMDTHSNIPVILVIQRPCTISSSRILTVPTAQLDDGIYKRRDFFVPLKFSAKIRFL